MALLLQRRIHYYYGISSSAFTLLRCSTCIECSGFRAARTAARLCGRARSHPEHVQRRCTDVLYNHSLPCMQDVETHGLGLLLFPEWYSEESMSRMHFFDDNTRSWWVPVTGGSNIPAVNDLVAPFGLAFGDTVLHGSINLGKSWTVPYASGTHLVKAPAGTQILTAMLSDHTAGHSSSAKVGPYDVLGLLQHGAGRVATFGDASCVDANHATTHCHGLLHSMLLWVTDQEAPAFAGALSKLDAPLGRTDLQLPSRPSPNLLDAVSYVKNNPEPICLLNSACGFQNMLAKVRTEDWSLLQAQQVRHRRALSQLQRISSQLVAWMPEPVHLA
jgi:hypothetical protein